jgi:hypothetical protein
VFNPEHVKNLQCFKNPISQYSYIGNSTFDTAKLTKGMEIINEHSYIRTGKYVVAPLSTI